MSSTVKAAPRGASARQLEKFARRREELAEAALTTLAELGYARTSLRDIAQHSDFSHGVLHYYFTDKVDLITHCVRRYKVGVLARCESIAAASDTVANLRASYAAALRRGLQDDGHLHRLWYDLKAQALYEPSFRDDIADIEQTREQLTCRIVDRLAQLQGVALPHPAADFYAVLDHLFQQALLRHLSGHADAAEQLLGRVARVLDRIAPGDVSA